MASKKLRDNIDIGLWAYYGHPSDDYSAAVGENMEEGTFSITFHKGEMPAFGGKTVATLDELETEMRAVQNDLRKWRLTEH